MMEDFIDYTERAERIHGKYSEMCADCRRRKRCHKLFVMNHICMDKVIEDGRNYKKN